MGIHQISRDRMIHAIHEHQTIKVGQIIQGKILKLYPNQKAQIQLGSQIMIAQLEAALAVGERYHFQVEATDDLIHLKVIGEHLKNRPQTHITELLQALGLKTSKGNIEAVQNLMLEKVPFTRAQLAQGFALLDGAKNKPEALQVLKEMMIHRLPMNESVFQALLAKNTTALSSQLEAVIQQLQQTQHPSELQFSLLNRLQQMTEVPPTNQNRIISQIVTEANGNYQPLFSTLRLAGLIDQNVEFSTWKSQWTSYANQNQAAYGNRPHHSSVQQNTPFPVHINTIEQVLSEMINSQTELRQVSQEMVSKWSTNINEAVIKNMPLSNRVFEQFRNEITQKIMPIISNHQRAAILEKTENSPVQLRQLLTMIQQYASQQTYANVEQILSTISEQEPFHILPPQEKFLGQIRQMLQHSGLTDENLIAQDIVASQSNQTVKSMLIQMIQQDDSVGNERVQQLLHYINGLQLQSVQEVGSFIQANLVIPGEKLALNNDLFIEFESKKTEDGKINPEFCRILFYLDLANLQETIIDMQIQKRLVTVTVFNDEQTLKKQADKLQPSLKKGLESLNYQLINLVVKPLAERNHVKKEATQPMENSYEGIEFRI